MSAMEKLFVQIFEKKKRIIDQAHRQCLLFDQHLVSKLLIDGIAPPPWLSNPMLSSLTSDPKDLNEDNLIYGALFSRAQSTIPISGRQFSLQDNTVGTADNGQPQSGLHNEFLALNRDINAGDELSNLPDSSVNDVGRSSFCAPEMDSTAVSPQIQMESRISNSYNEPALSLAKLQRSKSRQRALELRHSAKAAKSCSGGHNSTGVCASRKTDSATSSPQLDHFQGSELAKVCDTNIQSCAETQRNDQSKYSGRVTRSKRLALKLISSNVISSSEVKEDGPQSNNVIKQLEPANGPCFSHGSCEAKETNKGGYQRRAIEHNDFSKRVTRSRSTSKRVTRSRSTSQTKCDHELLMPESSLAGGKMVEVQDFMQSVVNGGLSYFSKTLDYENENQRKATRDGDCCSDKHESNANIRRLPGILFQSSNEDTLLLGGSLKSMGKSTQSPQPSVSQHSQPPSMPNEGKSNSVSNIVVDKSATFSQPAAFNSYHELEGAEIAAGRPSSSEKDSKLDTEVAAAASCSSTRASTTSTTAGSMKPVRYSNIDSQNTEGRHSTLRKSLLEKSVHAEKFVAEKSLNARENTISGANATHNSDDRIAGTVAKVAAEFDVLVDKNNPCLGSSPKVGLDVSASRPPGSNFVKSVKPKQLDFDNAEELSMNGITGADLKAGRQDVPPDKRTLTMLEPGYLDDKVTSPVCLHDEGITDASRKSQNVMSSKSQSFVAQELCPLTSIGSQKLHSSTNRLIPSQTGCQNSSGSFTKEAMASKFALEEVVAEGNEFGSRILEDTCSTVVTDNDPLENAVQIVTDNVLAVGSATAMDESNTSLTGNFTSDMDHSCPQHKRRKIESHAERSHQEDIENLHVRDSTAEEMQDIEGYQIMEGSYLEAKSDQKFNLDGRDRSGNTLPSFISSGFGESVAPCLAELGSSNSFNYMTAKKVATNSYGFGIGSSKRCSVDKNLNADGSSSGRIYLGETAMLLEGSSVPQGFQRSDLFGTDETAPEIEGFIIQPDEAQLCADEDKIELEKMNLSSDTFEYASMLDRLSSSSFMHSPFCSSSNPYKLHRIPDIYQSVPNGLVEGMMGMRTSLPVNCESGKSFSDCLLNCKSQSAWDIKKPCVSPIQTLWDRINPKYGSSGKQESSKPELPIIDEENEAAGEIADTFQSRIRQEGTTGSIIREPLAEVTDYAKLSLISHDEILADGCGLDSVVREFSFCGTNDPEKQNIEKGSIGRKRFTGEETQKQSISQGTNQARRTTESLRSRSSRPKLSGKNSINKGPTYPGGKSSGSNIVSNITSFIPLVQQKQAAAEVITGKRDIKVKALEAAGAAKRMAERKENERKMKKEALRLERERIEQENRRQLELQNKKKEEERKKREAEMAAKKRQREEEERIEKERKRKRVEEAKQREEEEKIEKERKRKRVEEAKKKHQEREKICAKKEEKGTKCHDAVVAKDERECIDGKEKCNNLENNREGNMRISLSETFSSKNPMTGESLGHSEAVNDCGNKEQLEVNLIKRTETDDLMAQNTIEEQAYDISPYKGSDDEDEEDDDSNDNNNKFVPAWASKQRLYVAVSSQKLVDPETIFPLQSFCNISEVLLPRELQGK